MTSIDPTSVSALTQIQDDADFDATIAAARDQRNKAKPMTVAKVVADRQAERRAKAARADAASQR